MKPVERIGTRERTVVESRANTGYGQPLERFHQHELLLRTLIERLLPGVPANIDLAAFVDSHTATAMGRGDRRAGIPPVPELFAAGLDALHGRGFLDAGEQQQRALIGRMRRGEADGELGLPAKEFIDRLLEKALAGYLAHPDAWIRIGFTGPAYPEGYAWIGPAEALARHRKKPGWDRL